MSRRPAGENATVALFPFLAVLMSTMGSLILLLVLISRQARTQVENERKAAAEAADAQAAAQAVAQQRDDLEWANKNLAASRDKTVAELGELRSTLAHIEEHSDRLRRQIAEAQAALKALESETALDGAAKSAQKADLEELRRKIAEKEAELRQAEKAGLRPQAYAIVPFEGAGGTRRRPIYLECRSDRIILQPEGIEFHEEDFVDGQGPANPVAACIRASAEYAVRMNPARSGEQPYPLLLVRPDGVPAYYAARAAMSTWDEEFGYELIDAEWPLEFPPADPQLRDLLARTADDARVRQALLARAAPSIRHVPQTATFGVSRSGHGIERVDGGGLAGGGSRSGGSRPGGLRGGWGDPGSEGGRGGRGSGNGLVGTGRGNGYGNREGGSGGDGMAGGSPGAPIGGPMVGNTAGGGGGIGTGGSNLNGTSPGGPAPYGAGLGGPQLGNPGLGAAGGSYASTAPGGPGGPNASTGRGTGTGTGNGTGSGNGTGDGTGDGTSSRNGRSSEGDGKAQYAGRQPGTGSGGRTGTEANSGNGSGSGSGSSQFASNSASGGSGGDGSPFGSSMGAGSAGSAGAASSAGAAGSAGGGSGAESALQSGATPTMSMMDRQESMPQSLAGQRGADWGLPQKGANATGLSRPIQVYCSNDRIIVFSERGGEKPIVVEGRTDQAVDELVSNVWEQVREWGSAGRNCYWKPQLSMHVAPDGERRFQELRALLEGSGLEVVGKPIVLATPQPADRQPRR